MLICRVNDDWELVWGTLTDISVGSSVLGIYLPIYEIYMRLDISESNPIGTEWQQVPGVLTSISVSRKGNY